MRLTRSREQRLEKRLRRNEIIYALTPMQIVKLFPACALVALGLAACGTASKPLAGSIHTSVPAVGRAKVDDPRATHIKCLRKHGLTAREVGQTGIQIGTSPGGPTVEFVPTPGAAQDAQISGQVQSAEVIGSALLYPHQAPANELTTVENCVAQGVSG